MAGRHGARGPRQRRLFRKRQAGATLVIAACALVALLGCAALTTDVGIVLTATSMVQNVADAAALAGAAGPIIGQATQVVQRVTDIVTANQSTLWPLRWNQADLVLYDGGDTVPTYGPLGAQDEALTVPLRATVNYLFGKAVGLNSTEVVRSATALRQTAGGGYGGLFVCLDTNTGDNAFALSGSRANFYGSVHSNSRVNIGGSNHHFYGTLNWKNRLRVTGSGHLFDGGTQQASPIADPLGLTVNDFAPFDYEIWGDYNVSGSTSVVPPGVYRVHGSVHVSGSNTIMDNVTFVADGSIDFSGSNHYYKANKLGVFAYTRAGLAGGMINISGSAPNSVGALYAPTTKVSLSGSEHSYTSIIAWIVDMSGSDYHIHPTPNFGGGGQTTVKLIN